MKRLVVLFLLFAAIKVAGQTTGYLRFDTVRIYKQNGTCELYLINSTKDSLGQLTNVGGGLTRFIKPRVINDSTFTVGLDTLVLRGASGGSGGSGTDNANIGAGYRLLVPSSQEIKTLFPGYGVLIDSSSNANGITFKIDTSCANCPVTRSELIDSTDRITVTKLPVDALRGATGSTPDTIELRVDATGGLDTNPADTSLRIADNGVTTVKIADLNVTTGKIAANAVTDAKLRQSAGLSVVGRASNSTGNVADITAASANQVVRVASDGNSVGFGAVNLASSNAVTGELPENNLQAFKPYPAEYVWNTLYERSSWPDLSDFATLGTASISLSGGYVNVTANTQDYTPRIVFKPEWAFGTNLWKVTGQYRITQFGSPSNWGGPGIKSLVNHDGANFGYQFFTAIDSDGSGNSFFTTENGSIITNGGAGPTKSLNDDMEFTMERINDTLRYTIRNITTSSATQTITYAFPGSNSPNILPNVGQLCFLMNAAGGTIQFRYLKIESAEIISPNVLALGNSKTANGATNFNNRWQVQLNADYPTVAWSAGSAERMDPDMKYKRWHLTYQNPEYVILASIYDNDIRAGFAPQDVINDMIEIENYWKGGGTTVLWMCFPEDSTAGGASGLTNIRNWLVANRPNNYINTWDALRVSGSDNRLADAYDAGDGVHLNAAAHSVIYSTIVASGKISTISTNRRTSVRTKDPNLRAIGDSIALAFDWSRLANNIPKVNSSYNVTGSMLWDNGSNVIASTSVQPTAPHANSRLSVDGLFSTFSTAGAWRLYGRSISTDFYEFYHNSSTLLLSFNGTDGAGFGTRGQFRVGSMTGISSSNMTAQIDIKGTLPFSSSSPGFAGHLLRVDSNTINYTGAGTGLGNTTANSFGDALFTATNVSNGDTVSNVTIRRAPRDGSNFTSTTKLAFYVREGAAVLGGTLSMLKRGLDLYATNGPRQMVVYDTTTGKFDRMAIPSGGGISGLTAGRVTLSTGATSIGDDGNLLYSTSNAGTLSVGTSATVGHLNVGGNRNFDGTGTSTGYGVGINSAATTFTDNVTSASGTTNFTQVLLAGATLAASNSSVTATAPATLRVEAPTAGTNVAITVPYAITAFGGAVWFHGGMKIGTATPAHNSVVSYVNNFNIADATSANYNVILPDATVYSGFEFTFKRIDASGNTCTVSTTSSQTIDGSTTYSLTAQYKYVTVVSVGGNWLIKANN